MNEVKLCLVIGEDSPYLNASKACYERVMRALLVTRSSLRGSFCTGKWSDRNASWIANVVVPASQIEIFREIAKCSFRYNLDIQVGFDVMRSVKWIDVDGTTHTDPHPEIKNMTIKALVLFIALSACGIPPQPSPKVMVGEKYLKEFLGDVIKYDVWDSVINNYYDLDGIYYGNTNIDGDGAVGLCITETWRPGRVVYLDPVFLKNYPELERVTIYHELGHCLLDLGHSDIQNDIMYYTLPGLQEPDWDNAVKSMFMRVK